MLADNLDTSMVTTIEQPELLVGLLLAHILADFYFQPFAWVKPVSYTHLTLPTNREV